jgi:chemotaxis protein MotB
MAEKQQSRDPMQSVLAPTIIVKRKKKAHGHGHHGGAWKIAYADFVTAMMAFFLLMWLLGSTSKYDKEGIEAYFNTPLSALFGDQGGAAHHTSIVNGGGDSLSSARPGESNKTQAQPSPPATPSVQRASMNDLDKQRLQQLKQKLTALIEVTPALKAFKDQIRIAITSEGLRIEIVDALNRPMFASGSYRLESYATTILTNIGSTLNDVDNRVSLAGHTDAVPYSGGQTGFSNWELSSERANAARRALVQGGMNESKVLQVRGLADALPLNKDVKDEPTNRRISILVLNKAAEEAFFKDGGRTTVDETLAPQNAIPAAVAAKSAAPVNAATKPATALPVVAKSTAPAEVVK